MKNSELGIRVKEISFLQFADANLPKSAKNQVCGAGEKPEDEHNQTKPHLHRD